EGALAAPSVPAALRLAQLRLGPSKQVYVIGGAQVYRDALPLADALELTEVQTEVAGDTQFPFWDRGQFEEQSRLPQPAENGVAFDFVTYRRKH
ncbi:MAG TPA: dihydrofolate reductase, partial [Burkholderiaceae bacterium]|nr:dihydrofolate reductase [Burkholderiaceae bacterium]